MIVAMRRLAPFAALGLAVVVASTAALLATVRGGVVAPSPAPTAAAEPTPRAVPELSSEGRLAYWRDGRLWVSGLDGSLRRAVGQIDDVRRVSSMRWSMDGDLIAFIDTGLSVAVVTTDGRRRDVNLSLLARDSGWRIADIRWAPDSKRIAATFLRPGDGRADAFLTDLTDGFATWTRLTDLNDLFVGDWISNDEFLASTAGGALLAVRAHRDGALSPRSVRPLTGATGASPILAPDGRIHFLSGRVPITRDTRAPYVTASRASVWSAAPDGSEVRQETRTPLNDVRLESRLPDGRYLGHRGLTSAQNIIGEGIEPLPADAGIIRRVQLAPDGRIAYGFARERIVRIDMARLAATPPEDPGSSVSVFLDVSGAADVWFPASLSLEPGGRRPAGEPAARYAFALGGHLWQMTAEGVPSLLRAGPPVRRIRMPPPRWSPTGEHLLAIEQAGPGASNTALVAVAIDREGEHTRLQTSFPSARSFSWSPEGGEVAVVVDGRGVNGLSGEAQLEVRFMDPSGEITREAIPGSEVAWTANGLFVMRDVSGEDAIELLADGSDPRTLVTRTRLVRGLAFANGPVTWGSLDAAADGSVVSLRLEVEEGTVGTAFLVLIGADGTAMETLRGEDLEDVAWSPVERLVGYTQDARTLSQRAVVHDPASGIVTTREGRFAGWSPDGRWYYVGRPTGLYAYRLDGGDGLWMGPIGLPVAITTAS